jgi:hypothetical protein
VKTCLRATEQIRRMRGGSQPQLMKCADERFYIVKFKNNTQGPRILANEMLATRLGVLLGLPMAEGKIIDVDPVLIMYTKALVIESLRCDRQCADGHSFGSLYVGDPAKPNAYCGFDAPPSGVANLSDFLGMLVFDTWISNTDSRQAVFHRECSSEPYRVTMIDHGSSLCGEEWLFANTPCQFLNHRFWVYEKAFGIDAFEPWLSKLEQEITLDDILSAAIGIPPEWYGYAWDRLVALVRGLFVRRQLVRRLIWEIHRCRPLAFPNWSRP